MSPTDKGVDSSRWEIVQDLLAEAMDLDAGDRPEFLDQSCHGDTELRSEVE